MPKNKTCEFCGKEGVDGRHINLCSKNPKNMSEPEDPSVMTDIDTSQPLAILTGGGTPLEKTEIVEPSNFKSDMKCPDCGSDAVKLNALDCRCPQCGDIEFVRVTKPAGV